MSEHLNYSDVKMLVESEGYELISKREEIENKKGFITTSTKINIWCKNKNHKPYKVTLGHFKIGRRCQLCVAGQKGKDKALTYEYVKEYIESFGYILLSKEYINNSTPLLVWCGNPNHEPYEVRFGNFKTGYRCPYCKNDNISERRSLKREYVENEINKLNYRLVDEKEDFSATDYILIECNHGHIHTYTWNQFKNGQRCITCNGNKSKGEERIKNILNRNKIKYIWNKGYFKDLYGESNKPLRPDFIIENMKIWIEFDGEQHFRVVDFSSKNKELAKEQFRINQENDRLKNEYAKKHNWKLIRIPYWEIDNIENILIKELDLKVI